MRVVTSGSAYLDIDAYACCIAYAELLNQQGIAARAVSSAPLNTSISNSVLGWDARLDDYRPVAGDEYVLMDVSDPDHFDPFVQLANVREVIDHHPGFEHYWAQRLGTAADIQPIGAAATLVFLRWEAAEALTHISPHSAALLATAILDNTLNFTGQMTTPQDTRAYDVLARRANLSAEWPQCYFGECQAAIEADLTGALSADMKRMTATPNLPQRIAQMTVWDAGELIHQHHAAIDQWLAAQGEDWLLNAISLRECKSYWLAGSSLSRHKLSRLVDVEWQGSLAVLPHGMQRKELLKLALAAPVEPVNAPDKAACC
ncbi:DHH family phosphoesterase [Pseudomonas sp. B6002]|uniref:DHH family phosphoesterase n=1 Tax=Pseudomonas sp. B6002 TaxID=2726978 RepID=UPI0015A25BD6|nr:DHH family phosphoesterase [Pseudomonas sp. B6002]NVZ53708.1 DHH family phosphoesterase [Pseudomonas sp. B6002]